MSSWLNPKKIVFFNKFMLYGMLILSVYIEIIKLRRAFMLCDKCNENIVEDSVYCSYCGSKVSKSISEKGLSLEKMNSAIEDIQSGVQKYIIIMDWFNKTDVTLDKEFQRKFNGYYKVRQRKPEFYEAYYSFMESKKGTDVTFGEILNYFFKKLGRVEASFSSKLLATINPKKPIWDEFVLKNLGLKKPSTYSKDRLSKIIDLYKSIENWYVDFFESEDADQIIRTFDIRYPNSGINNVKKIDFLLWKVRD